jgi:hypothetical protein
LIKYVPLIGLDDEKYVCTVGWIKHGLREFQKYALGDAIGPMGFCQSLGETLGGFIAW